MRIKSIHLQNFRNIEFANLSFEDNAQFFCGLNGQGKTNLLEALGYVTALRSFRGQDRRALIREAESELQIYYLIEHEKLGETEVLVKASGNGKEVRINDEKVKRLSDFLGQFPVVALSSEDLQLIRGASGLRRRFLDLMISAVDADYLKSLRRYHRTLQERNALLRSREVVPSMLDAYDQILADEACQLYKKRVEVFLEISEYFKKSYTLISQVNEDPDLIYKPDCEIKSSDEYLDVLNENKSKDLLFKVTQRGPHRDAISFRLESKDARNYASEGQQRGLVLALRFAQAGFFKKHSGVMPVVLADDVLGQLDSKRTEGFWRNIESQTQIIATGTQTLGDFGSRDWQTFKVLEGVFIPLEMDVSR